MGKYRKAIFTAGILLLITVVSWQLMNFVTSAEPLTEEEAKKLVEDKYNGDVVEIIKNANVYKIKISLVDTGDYFVEINRKTGDVESLQKVIAKGQEEQELTEADILEIVKSQQKGKLISLEKITEDNQSYYYAAVEQKTERTIFKINSVNGEIVDIEKEDVVAPQPEEDHAQSNKRITVQEAKEIALETVSGSIDDIEYEDEDGFPYYLVEIEQEHTEEEATVQIHAISGKVLSVSWDD